MSQINPEAILKLGLLARLGIDDELAAELAPQLKEILDYVAQLDSVDTTDTPTTNQVTGLSDIWRVDEVQPSLLTREQLLQNAPQTQDGYIKVKRVIQ
ncbi:MAG: Asp-tRNA(Asn)/Glu-tRNA(Gln) amidotransferase subunit GatC [Candidatus Saccharimonadales bacterium]